MSSKNAALRFDKFRLESLEESQSGGDWAIGTTSKGAIDRKLPAMLAEELISSLSYSLQGKESQTSNWRTLFHLLSVIQCRSFSTKQCSCRSGCQVQTTHVACSWRERGYWRGVTCRTWWRNQWLPTIQSDQSQQESRSLTSVDKLPYLKSAAGFRIQQQPAGKVFDSRRRVLLFRSRVQKARHSKFELRSTLELSCADEIIWYPDASAVKNESLLRHYFRTFKIFKEMERRHLSHSLRVIAVSS